MPYPSLLRARSTYGIAGALCVWAGVGTARAESEGSARFGAAIGGDGNPSRSYQSEFRPAVDGDAFAALTAALEGRAWAGERLSLTGRYDGGVRKFLRRTSEDTAANLLDGEAGWSLSPRWRVGVEGNGKDRRGGERDYTDLSGAGFVDASVGPRAALRLRAGARRFLYWSVFDYSFGAPELGLSGRYQLSPRHSLTGFAELGRRAYASEAVLPSGAPAAAAPGRRQDNAWVAGAGYAYRGPYRVSADYSFFAQDSNSYGEALSQHRLSAALGIRLPASMSLLAQAAVQLSRYPQGVSLSVQERLRVDDESLNALSLKWVAPLSDHWDFELRYALLYNRLPRNELTYVRQYGWGGLVFRL